MRPDLVGFTSRECSHIPFPLGNMAGTDSVWASFSLLVIVSESSTVRSSMPIISGGLNSMLYTQHCQDCLMTLMVMLIFTTMSIWQCLSRVFAYGGVLGKPSNGQLHWVKFFSSWKARTSSGISFPWSMKVFVNTTIPVPCSMFWWSRTPHHHHHWRGSSPPSVWWYSTTPCPGQSPSPP